MGGRFCFVHWVCAQVPLWNKAPQVHPDQERKEDDRIPKILGRGLNSEDRTYLQHVVYYVELDGSLPSNAMIHHASIKIH